MLHCAMVSIIVGLTHVEIPTQQRVPADPQAESGGAAADLVCVCPSVPSQSTVFYDISNSY